MRYRARRTRGCRGKGSNKALFIEGRPSECVLQRLLHAAAEMQAVERCLLVMSACATCAHQFPTLREFRAQHTFPVVSRTRAAGTRPKSS